MPANRILMILVVLVGTAARAQEPGSLSPQEAEQRSRVHFKLGEGHLQLKEYDEAIREFEIGYRYKPLPLFLYNIAQVAALAGQRDKALDYYERYLAVSPKAPERAEVTQRIAQLRRERAAAAENAAAAPAPAASPPSADSTGPMTTRAAAEPATPVLVQEAQAPSPSDRPKPPPQKHRGLRIGLALASGAVLIGGIIALGVTLSSHNDSGYSDWGTLVVTQR